MKQVSLLQIESHQFDCDVIIDLINMKFAYYSFYLKCINIFVWTFFCDIWYFRWVAGTRPNIHSTSFFINLFWILVFFWIEDLAYHVSKLDPFRSASQHQLYDWVKNIKINVARLFQIHSYSRALFMPLWCICFLNVWRFIKISNRMS